LGQQYVDEGKAQHRKEIDLRFYRETLNRKKSQGGGEALL